MKRIENGFPSVAHEEVIIVKLWEIYLLHHPSDLYRTLTRKSINNNPFQDPLFPGRVIFKFAKTDWDQIKNLLYDNRIPVTLQSNRLHAVSGKGRQPVLGMRT